MSAYVLGLTGPSGTGKTTVSLLLVKYGAHVINCDSLSHQAIKDAKVLKDLKACFGEDIAPGDELDRKLLASRAFGSRGATELLNSITHPAIFRVVGEHIDAANRRKERLIVLDAPTLIESGVQVMCDSYAAVIAPMSLRRERIKARDNLSETEMFDRLNAGHPDEFYTKNASFVINNKLGHDELEAAVKQIVQSINNTK